jgi:hypothetical protein
MTKIAGFGSESGSISETWIRGSGTGSTPKCHGSATQVLSAKRSLNFTKEVSVLQEEVSVIQE